MWAYKSYNPNAPEPPGKVSANPKPEPAPPPTPKFSFRSLFGRYNESGSLRREVSRLISPIEPDGEEEEEGDVPRGRSRKVSFSSNTSNRRSRSRRSRSSSLFSSLGSNFSESKSEVMLAEILELLKEIKDERRGGRKGGPDDSDDDVTDNEGKHADRPSRRRRTSQVGSSAPGDGISAMDTDPSEVTPYDDLASKASSAAKSAAIAAGKEYVKQKLPGRGKNKQDPKQAAALAAVESLKQSLGSEIKAGDILSELPSLGGMEGLQELLKAFQDKSQSSAAGDTVGTVGKIDEAENGKSRPESISGLSDILARVAALKASRKKTRSKPRVDDLGGLLSTGDQSGLGGGKKPSNDKHSWDKKSAPQAFDWPSKEEIDRNNAAISPSDEANATRGLDRDTVRSTPRPSRTEAGQSPRSIPPVGPKGRTVVDLPSSGASTIHSDFEAALDRDGLDDAYDIVFPSTPLHEPGLHQDVHRTGGTQDRSGATRSEPPFEKRPRSTAVNSNRNELQLEASDRPKAATSSNKISAGMHTRIAGSLSSCLAILKDLGVGHHSRNPDSSSSTYEESVLAWLGVWFSKQLPAYERATELFNHANTETQLDLLDCIARLGVLLEHPGLSKQTWDDYLKGQVGTRGLAVKTAFVKMAGSAVLGNLQQTLVSFDDSVTDIIAFGDKAYITGNAGMQEESMNWVPKLRRALQNGEREETADMEIRDEAMGLLDIMQELTSDLSYVPKDTPMAKPGPDQPETVASSTENARTATKEAEDSWQEEQKATAAVPQRQATLQSAPSALAFDREEGGEAARYLDEDKRMAFPKPSNTSRSVDETVAPAKPAESLEQYEVSRHEQMMPLLTSARRAEVTPSLRPHRPSSSLKRSSARSSDGQKAKSIDPLVLRRRLEGVRARPSKARDVSISSIGAVTENNSVTAIREKPKPDSHLDRPDQGTTLDNREPTTSCFPPGETARGDEVKVRSGSITKSVAGSTTHAPTRSSPLKKAMSPLGSPPVLGQESTGGASTDRQRGGLAMEGIALPVRTSQNTAQVDIKAPSRDDTELQERPKPESFTVPGTIESQPEQPATAQLPHLEEPATQAIAPARPPSILLEEQEPRSETELSFDSDTQTTETISDKETRVEQTETEKEVMEAIQEAREEHVDVDEPIGANQILTSADILSGRYGGLKPSQEQAEAVTSETEDSDVPSGMTLAEKDFQQEEVEEEGLDALVPAPKVITSKDIRDRRYNYQDFPRTLRSAVPRVETHSGAITSATTGEIVPFAEEQIHLSAGETLVDGTGRMWNEEGLVEPGKDDEGKFIVYDVDIAQIKREYGRVPAILPWESFEPDTPLESPSESFQTGDDWSGSEISMDPSGISTPATPAGRRPSMRVSRSEEAVIERHLQYNGQDRLSFIEEDDDDDHPLDDLEVAAMEEGEEKEAAATPGPAPGFGPFDGAATPY